MRATGRAATLDRALRGCGPVPATGKLAGATGTLALEGTQDLLTGEFTEDVVGLVCVNLAP